ncbi:TadE/TadG family type IV pilus assembly protein [Streptomyces sp. TRM70308]|uniref:TadE/TadG family type IV pilus assembly protein n=1 Tax=Streptomyces TaxID=1883 RepID=UPI00224910F5|nr:TadE/TadG family type IV pilus assembly protein [Streptomyces sp. JHD 1]MCX2969151.1 pilus assembly protein [Streptomyces sp. JHD 1]
MRDERGQATVEFLGMLPLILLTLALLWQCVLVGYTFTLAANAADEAARAGAVGADCGAAASADLPGAWASGAAVSCGAYGGLTHADVTLRVPVLFPGLVSFPFDVTADAAAVSEDPR